MKKQKNNFGKNLKELRVEKNLTQVQLAKKLKVTQAWISDMETKGKLPDIFLADRIELFFKKSIKEML